MIARPDVSSSSNSAPARPRAESRRPRAGSQNTTPRAPSGKRKGTPAKHAPAAQSGLLFPLAGETLPVEAQRAEANLSPEAVVVTPKSSSVAVSTIVPSTVISSAAPLTTARLLLTDLNVAEAVDAGACPCCSGRLVDRRGQLVCTRCRTLCDSVSDGGRWY